MKDYSYRELSENAGKSRYVTLKICVKSLSVENESERSLLCTWSMENSTRQAGRAGARCCCRMQRSDMIRPFQKMTLSTMRLVAGQ